MRVKAIGLIVALAVVAGSVAQATVVVPTDLKKLTARAQAIAHGRVTAVRSQWASADQRIETIVTMEVANYLKGNLGAQFIFRVPGGKVGSLRSVTLGAPELHQGDEVVVFVDATGPAIPHVVGFNQGVFRVSTEGVSGRRVVASPLVPVNVRGTRPVSRGEAVRKAIALDEFEQQVRALVETGEPLNAARPRRR
jgi:hypothetical protein